MGVSWLSVARTTVSVMVDRLASVNSPHTPGCQHPARRRRTISPATRRQPTTCCSRACDGEDVNMKPKAPRARQGRGGTRWEDFFRASQRAGLPTRARRSTTLRVRMDHRCFTRAMRRTNHAASPRVVERGVAPTQMPAPYPEEQTKRQAGVGAERQSPSRIPLMTGPRNPGALGLKTHQVLSFASVKVQTSTNLASGVKQSDEM